ncbi:MAG: nitrogenase component 1, partial [Tepidisphaerales bacterium]
HVTGYANMTRAMVKCLAQSSGEVRSRQVTIIPGWVEPADIREIKGIVRLFGLDPVTFPDTSDVLDSPQTGVFSMYPRGGATVDQIRSSGDSVASIALGPTCAGPAAKLLEEKCRVKSIALPIPIGLQATDRLVMALAKISGGKVPYELARQRGRLLDLMTDMHQYFYGKTVGLWGDPDQLVPLSQFLMSVDMLPKYVVTGSPGKVFLRRMGKILGDRAHDTQVRQGPQADMFLLHQWIKNEKVDLLIGNTYGKYIARDENIPFVRHGFPILDRIGHQYFPTVGYNGAIRLLGMMLAAFMDKQDRESPEETFELTM